MHGACLVSVTPPWTPHASVSPHPTLFYIFYKRAKLCSFCQEWWWWSSVAGTFTGQTGSAAALGVPCHLLHRGSRQVPPPPTSHGEPGKRTAPLYCLPTPVVALPPHPCPGYGHTPSKLSEGTCLAWFGPPSYLQRNDSAWGWGESGHHRPLPWQSLGTHAVRAGSSPSAPPFLGLCLWGQENGSQPPVRGGKCRWGAGHLCGRGRGWD